MTVATSDALPALPTALPPVERRATIPAGFRAGGAAIGIKASGRPDLAIIATLSDAPSGDPGFETQAGSG